MNNFTEAFKSPGYYIKRRLKANKPSMFGLLFILGSIVVSILGYIIMPDQTPNANDGAVQIQKLPPGSKVTFLKRRKNRDIEKKNFIQKAIDGQESEYIIVPILSYEIEDLFVRAQIFGKKNYFQEFSILDAVKTKNGTEFHVEYGKSNQTILTYEDLNGNKASISYNDLIIEFKENNFETRTYLLGTDKMGRDILSRLLFGTRISLSIGFIAVLISMVLGISLGSIAGFFGGKIDMFILWFMSVIWSIPGIILVIAISMALQSRGVWVAFVAVGLTMWVEVARVMRGQIMTIKEKLFVEAARAFGIKNFRIVFVHILPNIAGPIIVIATANFAAAILLEAGLSFLGLGVQPPTPSWGVMIYEGFQAIGTKNSLHLILFPGLAICILVLSFNLLGNGLRDAYDPKTLLE